MAYEKTINLTGTEVRVEIKGKNCDVRNDSGITLYVSRSADIVPDADGVLSVPAGQAVKYCGLSGAVYLLGTGKVQICGNNHSSPLFKCAATSTGTGEGGVSQTYVDMQDADTLNRAKGYAEGIIINPNLLINRDFSINQRGKTEYTGAHQYTVDMWGQYPTASIVTPVEGGGISLAYSGETAPSSGYVRVNQKFENQLTEGDVYTFQVCIDGVIYTKTFTATNSYVQHKFGSNNQYVVYTALADFILQLDITQQLQMSVEWAKLEPGAVATPFAKPDRALETLKCQRYLQFHTTNNINPVDLRPTMRITPTVAQYDDGRYMYSAEL